MKPLVSIIMPVYNGEEFIEESVRSICNQTYTNWELIIVNDGSKDGTLEKIKNFKESKIRVHNLKEHLGLTAAFNEGYKLIKGEFVIRHDADDVSAPNRLETQEAFLERKQDFGMVSCLISCFTREPLFRQDCIFIERIQNDYITFEEIKKATLGGFVPIIFSTLMIRKSALDKVIHNNVSQDFDDHLTLLLDLIKLTSVEKVNSILYSYRRHSNAYHVINQKKYEEYSNELLKNISLKNQIQYKEFYRDFKSVAPKNGELNKDSPIRILMIIDALNVGGTETHVLNITKKLLELGIYVVVATSGGPMEGLLQSYGIKIVKIQIESDYVSNKKKFGLIRQLKSIIDEEKINLVHCHLFASMQLASELYRMYRIPYIVTIHGLFYPNDVLYSTCIMASGVIAVSEPVKKMLETKLGKKIHNKIFVIPNGVSILNFTKNDFNNEIRKELDIPRTAKILCYCSRLDWNKTEAARIFLFSFSQLIHDYPDVHAVIVGDGSGKEIIEKEALIINEMNKKKIVHMVGAKVNVIPYYLESTIIIGTARVALEGMMCQKPVIALGNQGYTGIITETNKNSQWQMYFGDHAALEKPNVSKLVSDIKYLLKDSKRLKQIGDWGRRWCEANFNNDKIVKDILDIYKKSLESENQN